MERHELNRMFDALAPTPEQEQTVLDRLLHEERKVVPMKNLKKLTVIGIAAALMIISVAAANPKGVQAFFNDIAAVIQINQYRKDLTNVDGETVVVYNIPVPSVDDRNGRAILVIDGKDAADITDALRSEGRYTYDMESEEGQLHILVEGTAEEWSATVMIGEPGEENMRCLSTITNRSDGSGDASSPAYSVPFADSGDGSKDIPLDGPTADTNT